MPRPNLKAKDSTSVIFDNSNFGGEPRIDDESKHIAPVAIREFGARAE
jgi:hypothetical protein